MSEIATNTEQEPIQEKTLNGVKAVASNLRWEREHYKQKRDKLFAIIIRTAGEDGIREAYAEVSQEVQFPYYAIKGEWTTQKGRKMTAWLSAYGKFAGKIKKDEEDKPPILNGYKNYNDFNPENLEWDAENKKFKIINHSTQTIYYGGKAIEVKLAYN